MATLSLTGNDTIKINNTVQNSLPHGEVGKVTFSQDLVTVKTGKNGNTIYASNETGNQATFDLRLIKGSAEDKELNRQLTLYKTDPTKYVLMNAELVKVVGDGKGNITTDTYILTGGVITKNVEGISNVEGDVEQAISHYVMQFAFAPRAIA